jgi:RNA polymerase sigma-70 factor (ECF subfamily)
MDGIAAGEASALEALMGRHWGGLTRYAKRMRLSDDDACDVAQEVFVRVWEHRARWTPGGSAQGYLYRIARTLILEGFRKQEVRYRTQGEVRSKAGRVATPIEVAAGHELRDAIATAIEALPERRREAFILVRLEGLGLQAAAEALGVARQTVANHVHLAVQDLQGALGPFLA